MSEEKPPLWKGPTWPKWMVAWYSTLAIIILVLLLGHAFRARWVTLDTASLGLVAVLALLPLVESIRAVTAGPIRIEREPASARPVGETRTEPVTGDLEEAPPSAPSGRRAEDVAHLRFVEVWHGRTDLVVRERIVDVRTGASEERIRKTGRTMEIVGLKLRATEGGSAHEAKDAIIHLAFLDPDSGRELVRTMGRWSANAQLITGEQWRIDRVLPRDLRHGEDHSLDVAIKYEGDRQTYAAGMDFWLAPEGKPEELNLTAPTYLVRVAVLSADLPGPKIAFFELINAEGPYPSLQMRHRPDYQPPASA